MDAILSDDATIYDLPFTIYSSQRCVLIVAVGSFNNGLAGGIVTSSGDCFEPAFIDGLPTASAHAIRSLFNSQQRLIDIRNHLGFAFAQT